jgi:thioredoxin 1
MKKTALSMIALFILMLPLCFAQDVKSIGSAQEFDTLLNSGKPVVADFFADWCGPCKRLSPIMHELAKQYGDKVIFVKVDVDQVQDLAARFQISSIPDVRFFKNGKQQEQMVGLADKASYEQAILKVTK